MGRRRKFRTGQVVYYYDRANLSYRYGVVVDHKTDRNHHSTYRIVRSNEHGNERTTAVWVESYRLLPALTRGGKTRFKMGVASVVRANERIPDRGCRHHCCVHVADRWQDITDDGTYEWEKDG